MIVIYSFFKVVKIENFDIFLVFAQNIEVHTQNIYKFMSEYRLMVLDLCLNFFSGIYLGHLLTIYICTSNFVYTSSYQEGVVRN